MGSPDFAVPTLQALVASRHEVVAVLTNQDKPKGRGNKVRYTPVKQAALDLGIEAIVQPKSLKTDETYEILKGFEADVMIVAAYGKILPQRVLDIPRLGCINVHASLLPRYRGAAPINWCIVRGEESSGITIMQMERGLDTGPMLLKREVAIPSDMTGQELHDALSPLGGPMVLEALDGLLSGTLPAQVQDDAEATWAPMLSKSDGLIDWSVSARQVADHIRGLYPWPGAYSRAKLGEQELGTYKIHSASVVDVPEDALGAGNPGRVLRAKGDEFIVACGSGAVALHRLQAPGRRALDVRDFINGVKPSLRDRFLLD